MVKMFLLKRILFLLAATTSMLTQGKAQDSPSCNAPVLLFASDTQEPMRVEELYLRPNRNREATRALFKDMLDQDPTELFLLGDVVNLGYRQKRWTFIDSALALARDRGFNVHALLGNHEVMGLKRKGERRFQQRFPEHVRTGYVVHRDSIAVILLNSNFGKMSKAAIAQQDAWYGAALATANEDPAVRAIIVCCHHSPYSDSKLVGSSPLVQTHFVTPFVKTAKGVAFISGHAHLFQHFQVQGKDFFVIGGGGGLHHPLKKRTDVQACLEPGYDPMYHYLTAQLSGEELILVSRSITDSFDGFEDGCNFSIPLAKRASSGQGQNITTP